MEPSENKHKNNRLFVEFNIACWIIVFLISFLLTTPNLQDGVQYALLRMTIPLSMCIIFYTNYLWLVSRYYITKKYKAFFGINIALIIVLGLLVHAAMFTMVIHRYKVLNEPVKFPEWPLMTAFVIRNLLTIILSAFIAVLLRLAMRWQKEERKRREMEVQKAETDLKLLSNQIHPHFLLNTLNNIYALVATDQSKSQKAVMSLSQLLRRMLYGNQTPRIVIAEEIDFLKSYINLMSIRQQKNVRIETDFQVSSSNIYVAPNIFITLVENAFKHGVSPTEDSLVKVTLQADENQIAFTTENTNFPKNQNDKSGNGIGLTQVEKLLQHSYEDRFEWKKQTDTDKNIYISKIIIYDTKMRNH